jgi:hypothetical protein
VGAGQTAHPGLDPIGPRRGVDHPHPALCTHTSPRFGGAFLIDRPLSAARHGLGGLGGIARGRLNDRPFRRAASEPFNLSPTIGMQPARHGRCIDVATRGRFRTPIRHPADATSVPPDPAPRGEAQKRTYRRSACPALFTLSVLNCKNITVAELLLLHVAEMTATILTCNSHDPPES